MYDGVIYKSNCRWIETMARIEVYGFVGGLKQSLELKENCTTYLVNGKICVIVLDDKICMIVLEVGFV
jgi:hypothetical protein